MNKDVQIGSVVVLNSAEQDICKDIAKLRYTNNRSNGVKNAKMGNQSDEFTDLEGIASEFAFCKLFNVYPDLLIECRSSIRGEDNGDVILPTGHRVDVKATKYPSGKLLAVPWKKPDVDLFALMVGEFPRYIFKGFMKKDDLLCETRLGNLGHGDTYIAKQNELTDLKGIL